MRAALIIAARDLRAGIRDRTVIIMALIAPFGLAAIFSLVIPSGTGELDLRLAYADLDRSPISAPFRDELLDGLEEAGVARIVDLADADAARDAVDQDEVGAAILVPAGFGDDVQAGRGAEIEVIGSANSGTSAEVARAVAEAYAAELESIRLAVASVQHAGVSDPAELGRIAAAAAGSEAPITLDAADTPLRRVGSQTFYAAAMAIFFLFFTAQFGALSLLTERRQGTLPRLVAAPIRPASIILGKALGSFVIGIVAMTILVAASTFLLGARWGSPPAVALLVVAAVVAAMGITALITTFARTEEQAGGWNAIFATSMAILGGAFFPVAQGPEILRIVSLATPHAWFLRALDDLAVPTAGIADIWPSLIVLAGIGAATATIGMARAGRLVVAR